MIHWLKKSKEFIQSHILNTESESYHKGEGMIVHHTSNGEIVLENSNINKRILIKNRDHILMNIQLEDIDFDKVDLLENAHNARKLISRYDFGIDPFINGVALAWWTLYPDGRYFEDEDGFGGEACNETTIYAYMDTMGKIIIPFQGMNSEDKKRYRIEAEQRVK